MQSSDDVLCNCLAVRQAARQLTQLYDDALVGTGLRVTQYSVLARLARIEPATMQALSDALVMDRTTLTHNLKPLQRDGLVAAESDEENPRARRLRLTPLGRTKLAGARTAWKKAQSHFENAFGADEAAALRQQLARAIDSLR